MNFEETELRLGLPGGGCGNDGESGRNSGKRVFTESIDLKLHLSSKDSSEGEPEKEKEKNGVPRSNNDPAKPPAKTQVVGWPPVRSFRKGMVAPKNSADNLENADKTGSLRTQVVGWPPVRSFRKGMVDPKSSADKSDNGEKTSSSAAFIKVSMDGAPYLRKVDLKLYRSYKELSDALSEMFGSFTNGNCGPQGMMDFMNETKLIDLLNGSEYAATYEDKDGDWMLVGDVPWEMFVDSCKRMRIMKGSEAIGLAPRAVEKCKNRS